MTIILVRSKFTFTRCIGTPYREGTLYIRAGTYIKICLKSNTIESESEKEPGSMGMYPFKP